MTKTEPARIFPLSDRAVTVEFGNEISNELNDIAVNLARELNSRPFPGCIEAVPAFASATVYYEPELVASGSVGAYDRVRAILSEILGSISEATVTSIRTIEVPIEFGPGISPDLEYIAEFGRMDADKVIELFLSRTYRVYMLGFLPGFAYMGTVDERIAIPRKRSPRQTVPAGSVGIAGLQTGIYPRESPGGWQIIGRTGLWLLTDDERSPSVFSAGDQVRFVRA